MEQDKKDKQLSSNDIISIIFAVVACIFILSIFIDVGFTKIKPKQLRFAFANVI
jgi:hypothetical protein